MKAFMILVLIFSFSIIVASGFPYADWDDKIFDREKNSCQEFGHACYGGHGKRSPERPTAPHILPRPEKYNGPSLAKIFVDFRMIREFAEERRKKIQDRDYADTPNFYDRPIPN